MNTKELSKKHHYIPQYYLKGFTNEQGLFYRLRKDSNQNSIEISKNLYSPKSLFYEENRNTIKVNNTITDIIEKHYSDIDNNGAKLFCEINNGIAEEALFSPEYLPLLKQFIAIFLLRLPIFDDFINNLFPKLDFSKTRNIVLVNNENYFATPNFKERLNKDKGLRKYFRSFILPSLIFDYKSEDHGKWYIFDAEKKFQNHLCCDIPILVEETDINTFLSFNCDFIIPLNKNKILVHSMNKNIRRGNLPPQFTSYIDLLLVWQSDKYVVGSNLEYLKGITDCFSRFKEDSSFQEKNKYIFDLLKNN